MVRFGILGGADIAFRMFVPALLETEGAVCEAVASRQKERRKKFEDAFSVKTVGTYEEILEAPEIDAVYIPLPPALHYLWAKRALEKGKHVFLEKPSTASEEESRELAVLARQKNLVLQENYMFQYHSQLGEILHMLEEGIVGDVRMIRTNFGFPLREAGDFRYKKELGGGALLDAGGYVTKLASILLGSTVHLKAARLGYLAGYEVDMYGNALFENEEGSVVDAAFGMDCYYQCSLEVWGNKGKLFTNRIFTAPPGFEPKVLVETAQGKQEIVLSPDSHFKRSVEQFLKALTDDKIREEMNRSLVKQAELVGGIRRMSYDSF